MPPSPSPRNGSRKSKSSATTQHNKNHNNNTTRRQKRPPPPPPPPKSLVKLLGKDKAVLEYFRALQANLEADVQIWKDRAHDWERQVQELQQQAATAQEQQQPSKTKKRQQQQDSSDDDDDNDNDSNPQKKTKKKAAASAVASARKSSSKNIPNRSPTKPAAAAPASRKKHKTNNRRTLSQDDDDDDDNDDAAAAVFALKSSSEDDDDNDGKGHDYMDEDEPSTFPKTRRTEVEQSPPTPPQPETTTVDDIFSLPSDSDDSSQDDEDDNKKDEKAKSKTSAKAKSAGGKTADDKKDQDDVSFSNAAIAQDENDENDDEKSVIVPVVVDPKAQAHLDEVRSSLSELEVHTKDDDGQRKSDQDVVKDLRFAIHSLCRVALTDPALLPEYPPFGGTDHGNEGKDANGTRARIPAPNDHPVREGLRLAFRSVVFMDMYSAVWKDIELENRSGVYRILERSLQREVRQGWAMTDRGLREEQKSSHYDPEKEAQQETPENAATSTELDAKSLPQLSLLLERFCWARMLMGLYIARDDPASAQETIRQYLLATIPTLQNDQFRLAPVLSFVVLEAMCSPALGQMGWKADGSEDLTFESTINGTDLSSEARDFYAFSLYFTANIWMERAKSSESRIRHMALVEYAAYERLCRLCGWEGKVFSLDNDSLGEFRKSLELNLLKDKDTTPYPICLVLHGSIDPSSMDWFADETRDWNLLRLVCWCRGIRQLFLRETEETRKAVGSKAALNSPPDKFWDSCRDMFTWLWELNPFESNYDKVLVLAALLQCASMLGHGDAVIEYGQRLIDLLQTMTMDDFGDKKRQSLHSVLHTLREVSGRPLVRVINLQRRHDRWKNMVCQAIVHENLLVRAIGQIPALNDSNSENISFGGYAFDGEWPTPKLLETAKITSSQMAKLIQKDWKPLELVPFDRQAARNEKSACMHPSEVACALSHIASWKACERSLSMTKSVVTPVTGLLRHPELFSQGLHLAGYAKGPSLCHENAWIPPTPVCLVMEDDAVCMVDDFVAALQEVLEQLPRDFHYCALGYARPKSAPVVRLPSTGGRIGVPTHLFLATAYLVSLSGLSYLPLPVHGPVDAWLGLMQTENFRNTTGERLGVGSHGNGGKMTRKQLATLLKFRAFCAVPPLCQQPLRPRSSSSSSGGSAAQRWREKDTDIVYSGHDV